jgi:hypothetical protein
MNENKVIKAIPIDWKDPTPVYKLGDICWHKGINKRVEIITNPLYAAGRFSYNYRYTDSAGNKLNGAAAESQLDPYSQYQEFSPNQKIKVNLVPATPIKRLIEVLAPSLPKGDEIKSLSGTLARTIIKERDRRGPFINQSHFLTRIGTIAAEFSHWGVVSQHFEWDVPPHKIKTAEVQSSQAPPLKGGVPMTSEGMKPNETSELSTGVLIEATDE